MKWKTLIEQFAVQNEFVKPNPPATKQQIADVEKQLNVQLPTDIKEFFMELNGDNYFVFSTEQMVETNLSVREMDCFMPLDCLLFFADNGCGDYLGYPITHADGVRSDNVFMWEHEYDNRVWKANNLEDAIKKYYNNEI